MGRFDKDIYQKEIAIQYCLARGFIPFPEVIVRSRSELSRIPEVLTDIDVLGIGVEGDDRVTRTIFDCKTVNKMSAVNRAFWAAGVKEYSYCDEAFVILKKRAGHSHRISALSMSVDLHDETSFIDFAKTFDTSFPNKTSYQSSISNWLTFHDATCHFPWVESLQDLSRNQVPLTQTPWAIFRKIIAELKAQRGQFDPNKPKHLAVFLDLLASTFVLWSHMGRDIRRIYEPSMDKTIFEECLRYYLWGEENPIKSVSI